MRRLELLDKPSKMQHQLGVLRVTVVSFVTNWGHNGHDGYIGEPKELFPVRQLTCDLSPYVHSGNKSPHTCYLRGYKNIDSKLSA
jgi:hypothetical protein